MSVTNFSEEKLYKQNNRKIIMNRRGQGLSTNAIILIVLGVVVLAVLVIGFTVGWGKIAPWISTSNVDTIVTACNVACSTNSIYDYCSRPRELKAEETLKDVTCYYLSEKQPKYGVEKCSVSCDITLSDAVTEDGAKDDCPDIGKVVQYLEDNQLKSITCA